LNFLAEFVWRTDGNFDNQAKIKVCHEYIIAYVVDISLFPSPPVIDPNVDANSKLFKESIRNTVVKNGPKNPISSIELPKGFPCDFGDGLITKRKDSWPHYLSDAVIKKGELTQSVIVKSGWSSKELLEEFIKNNFNPVNDSKGQETKFVITKTGAIELIKQRSQHTSHVISVLTNLGNTQSTSSKLQEMGVYFDYPKPVKLIKYLLQMNAAEEFLVLDFFAGSGSTAAAVYELNIEKNKKINYILVQIPEKIESSENLSNNKQGTISKIAINRIKQEAKASEGKSVDHGFKVYRLQKSNYNIWKNVEDNQLKALEAQFELFKSSLIDEWKEEDLITEIIMLEGFPLQSDIKSLAKCENNIKSVSSDFHEHRLLVCLDKKIYDKALSSLELNTNDVFICLDAALTDEQKIILSDKGLIKTI
jgi:adenine-specific DNA-methyltransferase